jgi:hypothetical protein
MKLTDDTHFLRAVHLVAMLDGVDQGFFERQLDAEDVPFVDVAGLEEVFDLFLNSASFGAIARNGAIQGDSLAEFTLEFQFVGKS